MLQDMGEVILLKGEGQRKWIPKARQATLQGLPDTVPSFQDQLGKLSTIQGR